MAAEFDSRTWEPPPPRAAERGEAGTTESLEQEFLNLRKRIAEDEVYYQRDGKRLLEVAKVMGPERLERLQQDQTQPLDESLEEISRTRISSEVAAEKQRREIKAALAMHNAARVAKEKRRRAARACKTRTFTAWLWRAKATTGPEAARTQASVSYSWFIDAMRMPWPPNPAFKEMIRDFKARSDEMKALVANARKPWWKESES
jgi:hypothetical protein